MIGTSLSLSLVINVFSYREYWVHGSGERKSIALQLLDSVACTMHQCAVLWVSYFAGNAEALDK